MILWRRLDVPGHDVCRLGGSAEGPTLEGTAVFLEAGAPARLDYRVTCDGRWRSREGHLRGFVGRRAVDVHIARGDDGGWRCDGAAVGGLEDCVDLDLGFTPATNLLQLRRVNLEVGAATDLPVAWFDVATGKLDRLEQRYARRTPATYWYEAPRFDYAALLELDEHGFVCRYPGLWEAEHALDDARR